MRSILLVMSDRASDTTRFVEDLFFDCALVAADSGSVFLACFLCLGHADEPVEGEGGDDVEDAVGPEDTFVALVNCGFVER